MRKGPPRSSSRDAAAAACRAVTLTQAPYLHWLDELKSKQASQQERDRERGGKRAREKLADSARFLLLKEGFCILSAHGL